MLTQEETERLRNAIIATVASPVIGAIEDYTWEAIFHYVKNIPLSDPALGRTKKLYDAVDTTTNTGWSLKTLQINNLVNVSTFQFVIQRADIITKAEQLGFPDLTLQSPAHELGRAIIHHWNEKIIVSKEQQNVNHSFEGILLKNKVGTDYSYCEYTLEPLNPENFTWAWTVATGGGDGQGLQGKINGQLELIWYKNQKQLFRCRSITPQTVNLSINRRRLSPDRYVTIILQALQQQLEENLNAHLEGDE